MALLLLEKTKIEVKGNCRIYLKSFEKVEDHCLGDKDL